MATMVRATPSAADGFGTLVFRRLPLACLVAPAVAAVVAGSQWSAWLAPLPWLCSLVFVGLPHGAADLAMSRRLCPAGTLGRVWLAYAAIMAAVIAGYAMAPLAMITAFVLLSVWHFGRAHARSQQSSVDDSGRMAACAAVARGGITLGVPLAAWPAASAGVASDLLRLTGHDLAVHPLPVAAVQTLGIALVALALACAAVEMAMLRGDRRRVGQLLVELTVTAAVGYATDPLFSVGTSFLVWHSWRQMEPLAEALTGTRPETWPALARAIVRIHVAALPLLFPTWLAIGLAWWFCSGTHSPRDLAILSIGAYLVVTPAHELLGDLLGQPHPVPAASCPRRSASWSA